MKILSFDLDRSTGYLCPLLIVAYTYLFGVFQIGSVQWGIFTSDYLVILLPIWLTDGFKSLVESFFIRSYHHAGENLRKITVIIACKDGEQIIGQTLQDLLKRFKPNQIIVASNGSTDRTVEVSRSYGVEVLDINKPLGKVRAINAALHHVKSPYVLVLDDDTLIGEAHLPTGLLDEGYDAVAFRVFVEETTWVTKLQAHEYRKSTDIGKRYHNNKASVQNISGAIGLFTLKHMWRQIRRHTGEFAGEDLQRTLLIHLAQDARGVVLSSSIVMTIPPNTLKKLFDQRVFGWFPGLYANFGNYFKILTRDVMPLALRIDAFYNCFIVMLLDILRLLSLPILFFYPWYFVVMYISYLLFEVIAYWRTDRNAPIWVVILVPLYGLFSFTTRVCAFTVFLYRRLSVKLGHKKFLDDFCMVAPPLKLMATIFITTLIGLILGLNVWLNYSYYILSAGF